MNENSLQNLKKYHKSESEARENGKKGGFASGRARREKKQMKEAFAYLLAMDIASEDERAKLQAEGVDEKDMSVNMQLCAAMLRKALSGDVKAAEFIATMTGQKPSEKIDLNGSLESALTLPPSLKNATMEELRAIGLFSAVEVADTEEYDTDDETD